MTRKGLIIMLITLYVYDFTVLANIILASFILDLILDYIMKGRR